MLLALVWLLAIVPARAGIPNPQNCLPIDFFTNTAARFLSSQLNLDLDRIQVYPTNQYTPAAHRLLQVTANLYDAATNRTLTGYPFLPSVFRPLFRRDAGGAIYIAGYRELHGTLMADPATAPVFVDLQDPASRGLVPLDGTAFDPVNQHEPMVSGVPFVIGAKKDYPSFNQFALQNDIVVTRKLGFHRYTPNTVYPPYFGTNQSYLLAITNAFGVQCWNSYSNTFPRPLQLVVSADVTLMLTNGLGLIVGPDGNALSNTYSLHTVTNIPADCWTGYLDLTKFSAGRASFVVPALTNRTFLQNSAFVSAENRFYSFSTNDQIGHFPVPDWFLCVRERVRYFLIDTTTGRLVDAVNLDCGERPLDVCSLLHSDAANCGSLSFPDTGPTAGDFWCANRVQGTNTMLDPAYPTFGIQAQIAVCLGVQRGGVNILDSIWRDYNSYPVEKEAGIETFGINLRPTPSQLINGSALTDFSATFNPRRVIHQYVSWQANDPLVHYTVLDLFDPLGPTNYFELDSTVWSSMDRLSNPYNPVAYHFRPWGGNPYYPYDTPYVHTIFNPAVKDPQVTGSDCWDFPSGEPLTFANIGRVHRGSPWQTIYLQSTDLPAFSWALWTGWSNLFEAAASRPITDRNLVALLAPLLGPTDPRPLLSLNSTDTSAWLAALDSLVVLTNTGLAADPLTVSSNSPQAAVLADAIQRARASQPGGFLVNPADLLAIPELADKSLFINTNNLNNPYAGGISDAVLEAIPAQLLSRVRADSFGSIAADPGRVRVKFTGYDQVPYRLEQSPDLVHWTPVGTNIPVDGVFAWTNSSPAAPSVFYRSMLLP
ncbi:MAG: hypothetical protein U1F98_14240 [Verrucomicrobiota bacterium]